MSSNLTSNLPSTSDVYLRIYEGLKKEIATDVKDARAAEHYTLLLTGGIWTFLAQNCSLKDIHWVWYLPAIFAIFSGIRVTALMFGIGPRARYLQKLEDTILEGCPIPGWEKSFTKKDRRVVGATIWLFWLVMIGATVLIPHFIQNLPCTSVEHGH